MDSVQTAEPQDAKDKGKERASAEKEAHKQEGIRLPIELIGRVFDFYYDSVHDGKLSV